MNSKAHLRPPVLERLEQRTLLAALTPHQYTLTLYHDDNLNGRRDVHEHPVSGFGMFALVHNASGDLVKRAALTDINGQASLTNYVSGTDTTSGKVRFRVPVHVRFQSTTNRTDSLPAWYGDAFVDAPSATMGLTDRARLSGQVNDFIAFRDGFTGTNPLSLRRVYDDRNNNGKYDKGEPNGLSNLDGKYTITLRSGAHTLRLQKRDGWAMTSDSPGVITMSTRPDSVLPTFTARMSRPVIVDVIAGYTTAAADGRGKITMYNYVRNLFIQANRAYANSDTNVLINLRKVVSEAGYTESGNLSDDLDVLGSNHDGVLDDMWTQRKDTDSDLATLLTSDKLNTGDSIGIAYEFNHNDSDGSFAFSVIALRGDGADDDLTLAHEIGHNLGAGHDPAADDGDTGDDAPAVYAHGYVFKGDDGRHYKDVMAYGTARTLPFFSTPRFRWAGELIGNADTADNSRIIRELAPDVADYR